MSKAKSHEKSALKAAECLMELLEDESLKPELRKSCAESILDRVYGKGKMAAEEQKDDRIVLGAELKKYAD